MYEPTIEIRGKETSLTKEDLLEGYESVQRSLNTFFGPGQELQPGTVKTIEARHPSTFRFTEPTFFAEWQQSKRKAVIIDRGIHQQTDNNSRSHQHTLVDELGHELGHAFQMQLQQQLGAHVAQVTSEEGFADWIRIVTINEGDSRKVNSHLGGRLYEGVKLFSDFTKNNPYPTEVGKLTDAAILNYLYKEYGMDIVMKACTLPPLTTLPETLLALGVRPVAFPLSKFGLGQKALDMFDVRYRGRLEKRYDKYAKNLSEILGISSLDELVQKAIAWYKDEERVYTASNTINNPSPSFLKGVSSPFGRNPLTSRSGETQRTHSKPITIPKRTIGFGPRTK